MNRRTFFSSMVGGVAATAAVRTWPFRVYSFPQEIVIARSLRGSGLEDQTADIFLQILDAALRIPPKRGPFRGNFSAKQFGPTLIVGELDHAFR